MKYRAWDKEFKQMTDGNWLNDDHLVIDFTGKLFSLNDYKDTHENGSWTTGSLEDRFILMQYTGLKDKNGEDIYEGDILEEEGVVIFRDGAFETDNYPLMNFFIYGFEEKLSKLKVIGNIYKNPELCA